MDSVYNKICGMHPTELRIHNPAILLFRFVYLRGFISVAHAIPSLYKGYYDGKPPSLSLSIPSFAMSIAYYAVLIDHTLLRFIIYIYMYWCVCVVIGLKNINCFSITAAKQIIAD